MDTQRYIPSIDRPCGRRVVEPNTYSEPSTPQTLIRQSNNLVISLDLQRGKLVFIPPKLQLLLHLELDIPILNDQIFAPARCQKVAQVRQCPDFHLALRVLVFRPHMRQKSCLRELEQSGIHLWLVGININANGTELLTSGLAHGRKKVETYVTILQCSDHGVLINDLASRGVNDNSTSLQCPDPLFTNQTNSFCPEWNMYTQHISLSEHLLHIGEVFTIRRSAGVFMPRVVDDAHGEGLHQLRKSLADPAQTKDSKGLACHIVAELVQARRFPRQLAQGTFGNGVLAHCGKEQIERRCCGGVVYGPRSVGEIDTCPARFESWSPDPMKEGALPLAMHACTSTGSYPAPLCAIHLTEEGRPSISSLSKTPSCFAESFSR